jgi:hypothetical protein
LDFERLAIASDEVDLHAADLAAPSNRSRRRRRLQEKSAHHDDVHGA